MRELDQYNTSIYSIMSMHFMDLPSEILGLCMSTVDITDIWPLRLTCKRLNGLLQSDEYFLKRQFSKKELWKSLERIRHDEKLGFQYPFLKQSDQEILQILQMLETTVSYGDYLGFRLFLRKLKDHLDSIDFTTLASKAAFKYHEKPEILDYIVNNFADSLVPEGLVVAGYSLDCTPLIELSHRIDMDKYKTDCLIATAICGNIERTDQLLKDTEFPDPAKKDHVVREIVYRSIRHENYTYAEYFLELIPVSYRLPLVKKALTSIPTFDHEGLIKTTRFMIEQFADSKDLPWNNVIIPIAFDTNDDYLLNLVDQAELDDWSSVVYQFILRGHHERAQKYLETKKIAEWTKILQAYIKIGDLDKYHEYKSKRPVNWIQVMEYAVEYGYNDIANEINETQELSVLDSFIMACITNSVNIAQDIMENVDVPLHIMCTGIDCAIDNCCLEIILWLAEYDHIPHTQTIIDNIFVRMCQPSNGLDVQLMGHAALLYLRYYSVSDKAICAGLYAFYNCNCLDQKIIDFVIQHGFRNFDMAIEMAKRTGNQRFVRYLENLKNEFD